jgi:hypothetical protein
VYPKEEIVTIKNKLNYKPIKSFVLKTQNKAIRKTIIKKITV